MTNLPTASGVAFSLAALLFSSMFVTVANADPVADAKTVTDAFNKAFEACDVPAVLALYEDNAIVIWPGQGEFATDKAAFEKIVKANCSGPSKPSLKEISSEARQIDKNYIVHTGQLDDTGTGPDGKPSTIRIRTTELLHKSAGKWRYAVDHASVGLAPAPPATDSAKTP